MEAMRPLARSRTPGPATLCPPMSPRGPIGTQSACAAIWAVAANAHKPTARVIKRVPRRTSFWDKLRLLTSAATLFVNGCMVGRPRIRCPVLLQPHQDRHQVFALFQVAHGFAEDGALGAGGNPISDSRVLIVC